MRRTDIVDPKVVKLIEKGLNGKQVFDDDVPMIVGGQHVEAGRLLLLYLPDKVILISEIDSFAPVFPGGAGLPKSGL
jgi:hypothetical protein